MYSDKSYYNSTYNSFYNSNHESSNHAVVVVGWDDNFSKDNFNTPAPGNGAWIIRNSWVTGDFDSRQAYNGYFYLSYYDVAIEGKKGYSFVFDPLNKYDYNYQYDLSARTALVYASEKGANVFTTNSATSTKKPA